MEPTPGFEHVSSELLPHASSRCDAPLRRAGCWVRGLRPHQLELDLSPRMALVEVGERFVELLERVPPVYYGRHLSARHELRDSLHVLLSQLGDEEHGFLA